MARGLARLTKEETDEEVLTPLAAVPTSTAPSEAQDIAGDQANEAEPTVGPRQGLHLADRPVASPLGAPPAAGLALSGQRRRRAVELCCVLALLGSVVTAGLLAWSAVEAASSATHFRTVLTMSSSDPRGAGGSMVSSPFLTYNEVRVLLSTAQGGSPAHLSGLIVALNQANASRALSGKAITLSTTAATTVTGLGGLYELRITTPGRQRWSLAIQTPS